MIPFLRVFLLALLGVAASIPTMLPRFEEVLKAAGDQAPPMSVVVAGYFVQTGLLVAVATVLGTLLARRIGLRSHLAQGRTLGPPSFKSEILPALIVGAVLSVVALGFDFALRPLIGNELDQLEQAAPRDAKVLLAGLLYGGITEEVLLRYGLVTLLAWGLWRVVQKGQGTPARWIAITSVSIAAIAFGALHLPALSMMVPLTPALVARTILLNALIAGGLGWLYWRYSLEAAFVAHANFHVVTSLLLLVLR